VFRDERQLTIASPDLGSVPSRMPSRRRPRLVCGGLAVENPRWLVHSGPAVQGFAGDAGIRRPSATGEALDFPGAWFPYNAIAGCRCVLR
jgi:hypothetical protein